MITTIIFSLEGISTAGNYLKALYVALCKQHRLSAISIEEIGELVGTMEQGNSGLDRFCDLLKDRLDFTIAPEDLSAVVSSSFRLKQGMFDILPPLSRGHRLVFVSNGPDFLVESFREKYAELFSVFDTTFIAGEQKKSEGDKGFLSSMLSELGVSPDECVLVDDAQGSLLAAKELGISTSIFTDKAQLLADLQDLGVKYDPEGGNEA